jgi:hypothetical protein
LVFYWVLGNGAKNGAKNRFIGLLLKYPAFYGPFCFTNRPVAAQHVMFCSTAFNHLDADGAMKHMGVWDYSRPSTTYFFVSPGSELVENGRF